MILAPRMIDPKTGRSTFIEGVSEPGVISYGLTTAGYDFRLGEDVRLFVGRSFTLRELDCDREDTEPCCIIDPKRFDPRLLVPLKVHSYQWAPPARREMLTERYVILPAHGYALAETVEWLDVPRNVDITVLGKSTYARSGIVINATPLEAGWSGRTTLEIANVSDIPAKLYVGEGIAQAKFTQLDHLPDVTYDQKNAAKYQNQIGLTPARV